MKSPVLGKGLQVLFSEQEVPESATPKYAQYIKVDDIELNNNQSRKIFTPVEIEELKNSIIKYGILVPLLVKKVGDKYQIIAGERRYRAIKSANLTEILVRVIEPKNEEEALEISLIENIQRQNLNSIEIAEAFQVLTKKYDLTHQQIADSVSINRSSVTNFLRLNDLPEEIKVQISANKFSFSAAKAILKVEDKNEQIRIMEKTIKNDWSVRYIEEYISRLNNPKTSMIIDNINVFYKEIEEQLRKTLNTKVTLTKLKDKGKIEIEYYNDEDLERILGVFQ